MIFSGTWHRYEPLCFSVWRICFEWCGKFLLLWICWLSVFDENYPYWMMWFFLYVAQLVDGDILVQVCKVLVFDLSRCGISKVQLKIRQHFAMQDNVLSQKSCIIWREFLYGDRQVSWNLCWVNVCGFVFTISFSFLLQLILCIFITLLNLLFISFSFFFFFLFLWNPCKIEKCLGWVYWEKLFHKSFMLQYAIGLANQL